MYFETILFLQKMTFSNPPTPLKCGIFRTFFLKPSLNESSNYKKNKPYASQDIRKVSQIKAFKVTNRMDFWPQNLHF